MVTNYPRQLSAAADGNRSMAAEPSVVGLIVTRVCQFVCGLSGHDSMLHFEATRVRMRCTSCGFDTPGWEISGRGPRRRFEGDAHRHLLTPKRLVLRKSA